ncbi:MAG: methyltransferase domain-containing protein [Leptospirales bacterium]|nr:methyltransferase domain-containing protein [Leptospirales bacterium]
MASVGDNIQAENSSWTFGGDVPKSFDAHVSKSVPLYEEGHDIICKLSDYFLQDGSTIYDLGCSTGELLLKIANRHPSRSIKLIGIDREPGMVEMANEKCKSDPRISFQCSELLEFEMQPCDLVIAYYTVQFVRPAFRQDLLNRVWQSLQWGGAFLMFEKVRGPDARFQDILTGLYNDYKSEQGYNAEEILGKARSLKGVLEPFSTAGNLDLLTRAGFKDCMSIMRYLCFEGTVAIK